MFLFVRGQGTVISCIHSGYMTVSSMSRGREGIVLMLHLLNK